MFIHTRTHTFSKYNAILELLLVHKAERDKKSRKEGQEINGPRISLTENLSMWIREEGVRRQFLNGLHNTSRPFLHVHRSGRHVYNKPWPQETMVSLLNRSE